MMKAFLAAATAALMVGNLAISQAETWVPSAGSNFWSDPNNWSPASVPNSAGAAAHFTNPTTGVNEVLVDTNVTVGSIEFNLTGSTGNNDYHINPDLLTPGTLTLNNNGAGATIVTQPGGIPNNDIGVEMVLNDNLTITLNQTENQSTAGSLSINGAISGSGGLTKDGPGTLTLITPGAKTYTGPTVFAAGKVRLRGADALPVNSSSFRILSGATIEPGFDGTVALGAGTLYLNGLGLPAFPGVIRPDRTTTSGRVIEITNPVVLESTSLIHSQTQNDITQGSITLSGPISGASDAQLQFTGANSNNQIGSYILEGNNTYQGGTLLHGGRLVVSNALGAGTASLGTGNVTIEDNTPIGTARTVLEIESGLTNAIGDSAILSLAGGGAPGVADTGYVNLGSGINETIGGLMLAGIMQSAGTYGASGSGAMFVNDDFFAGSGIITVVPAATPIPGDFNHSGTVDGADLVIWKSNFGSGNGADADGDGDSDGADFLVWQQNVGQHNSVAAVTGVPEPAAAFLLTVAGMAVVGRMRKR
jgi:autotransporter-associated beta strand protein